MAFDNKFRQADLPPSLSASPCLPPCLPLSLSLRGCVQDHVNRRPCHVPADVSMRRYMDLIKRRGVKWQMAVNSIFVRAIPLMRGVLLLFGRVRPIAERHGGQGAFAFPPAATNGREICWLVCCKSAAREQNNNLIKFALWFVVFINCNAISFHRIVIPTGNK